MAKGKGAEWSLQFETVGKEKVESLTVNFLHNHSSRKKLVFEVHQMSGCRENQNKIQRQRLDLIPYQECRPLPCSKWMMSSDELKKEKFECSHLLFSLFISPLVSNYFLNYLFSITSVIAFGKVINGCGMSSVALT